MLISFASTDTNTDVELAARLRLVVTRLARRLRQQSAEGLTPSQISALSSIERHVAVTPSELAALERIQRPSATRLLNGLMDAGLITRQADSSDRRVARLSLTREGVAVLKRGRSRKNAYLARKLRTLQPEELEALERAAAVIERLLQEEHPE